MKGLPWRSSTCGWRPRSPLWQVPFIGLRIPRHAPNKDTELLGLTLMWLWWAVLSAIFYAYYRVVKQLWEGRFSA